jgi:chromosome segregation ATPase
MQLIELLSKNPQIFETLTGLLGLVSAVAALWWKLSKSAARTSLEHEKVKEQLIKFSSQHEETTKALIQLATKLDEREKDVMRLEGAFETQRRDLMHLITGLQQATSSLDAMWRTLQGLFPDTVPRRASDKVK